MRIIWLFIGMLFAMTLCSPQGRAHSWYPNDCCHDVDCHPISCEEIEEQKDGSAKWNGFVFAGKQIRPSQDSKCHACIMPRMGGGEQPLCLFTQQNF